MTSQNLGFDRMDAVTPVEDRRLVVQAALDKAKSQTERNKLGQFATPTGLASDVLAYARGALPSDVAIRFLDPAIGTGSFYAALLREFPAARIESARGFEVDPHYGKPARELWAMHPIEITLGDFTVAKPPLIDEGYNLVICNPPYVRHHHMDKAAKARLLEATAEACGVRMDGLAGLYCHFLGLAHTWMAADGVAGWLIPSEFMDVNYGAAVKQYLTTKVDLFRVHRFDPNALQFGDALVSSAVVWFRKRKPRPEQTVEFSYGGTLESPQVSRLLTVAQLQGAAKWSGLAANGMQAVHEGLKLSDYFAVKRGLATGDNGFFIMTPEKIVSLNLPLEFFKPILPSPRYLTSDLVEADADGTPQLERRLFLLDCRLSEAVLEVRYPSLWAYLKTGKQKVSETYLCSRRSPWYAQENRPAAPFVCTYMGRNLAKRDKPFRFILNRSSATAANVYLLLYPKPILAAALAATPGLDQRVWKFLSEINAEILLGEGRVYGGGLYKLEPKELGNVPANAIAAMLPPTIDHLAEGDY